MEGPFTSRVVYRHDQESVVASLRRGEPIDMATYLGHTQLDELVAVHEELGILPAVERLAVNRARGGIPDDLLLRTAAVLPFLDTPSLQSATGELFGEPAILLCLGWLPLHIRLGDNERRHAPPGASAWFAALPSGHVAATNRGACPPRPGPSCSARV
jgi:hypothetical protein